MKLFQIGERKIISILEEYFEPCSNVDTSIGDDAAVLKVNKRLIVVSSDMVREKTHVPREMSPWKVGWYSVNASLSDIASMGALPSGILLSLGLREDMRVEDLREFASGIKEACRYHNTYVIGGDTKAHSELTVVVTALGEADRVMRRNSARRGDLICVTGKIGEAAAGFYCLVNKLDISEKEYLLKAAFEPIARVREGNIIAEYSKCCMDISDGLAFSLYEIAEKSNYGFEVFEKKVPRSMGVKKVSRLVNIPEREMIFHKGGDFELLFTIAEGDFEPLKKALGDMIEITHIGYITDAGRKLITEDGREVELPERGYESFM